MSRYEQMKARLLEGLGDHKAKEVFVSDFTGSELVDILMGLEATMDRLQEDPGELNVLPECLVKLKLKVEAHLAYHEAKHPLIRLAEAYRHAATEQIGTLNDTCKVFQELTTHLENEAHDKKQEWENAKDYIDSILKPHEES